MGDGIFLVRDGQLVVLREERYAREDLLQAALAKFPAVLAGGATTADGEGRELFLIDREVGVPREVSGPSIWSLDNLFVDSDAVPVIVEVKRSTDTRLRREVVGQMLDYAANGVRYWPVDELRERFEARGPEEIERLRSLVGDPDAFWDRVGANLRDGRIRMVFVADAIPDDLVRIIEFLNEQMSPAEVLGVEVPQYKPNDPADDLQVFVPRLVGRTSAAVAVKQGTQWDEASLLDVAARHRGSAEADVIAELLVHGRERGRMYWGKGKTPAASAWYRIDGTEKAVWAVYVGGDTAGSRAYVSVYLPELKKLLSAEAFERVVRAFEEITSALPRLEDARATGFEKRYPSVFVSDLVSRPSDLAALLATIDVATTATSA